MDAPLPRWTLTTLGDLASGLDRWGGSQRVATYAAVQGVMAAIEGMLSERFPAELKATPISGSVQMFGSQTFKQTSFSNTLALYLYRISIDPTIPGGTRRALPGAPGGNIPEVPLMLHFLMIAIADTAYAENCMMGWGFQQLAITPMLGADRLAAAGLVFANSTVDWDDADYVQVATEELTREELMRIWDTLPLKYCLTVPYIARGLRVTLQPDLRGYGPVIDRSLSFGPRK
jgi:hypothetical protein